ncbi:MAG: hypothetical protein KatS3mg111_2047 [Pirellulaceae bacterium]|nr:MAG: hypothetical protein KatS3mg111_2047 [Pirellulaceae bacterium]
MHLGQRTTEEELGHVEYDLPWDAEIDTPATIAVVGGGRAGIEATLYARFLGYDVQLYERRRPGKQWDSLRDWPMNGTWEQETSPLGRAALVAQDTPLEVDLNARPSFAEYVDRYLLPLAKTDLVYDCVQIQTEVRSISRLEPWRLATTEEERWSEQEFRVLVASSTRGEYVQRADIVLDCSGHSLRLGLGPGGGAAAGQQAVTDDELASSWLQRAERPNVAAGQRCILWGNQPDAVQCAMRLAEAEGTGQSPWLWLVPHASPESHDAWSHLPTVLADAALRIATRPPSDRWACLPILGVERVTRQQDGLWHLLVRRTVEETVELTAGGLIVDFPHAPDWSFSAPLFAACQRTLPVLGLPPVLTSQPHYYVLGAKGDGRARSEFRRTMEHIRTVFALVGGRADLDLYQTVAG